MQFEILDRKPGGTSGKIGNGLSGEAVEVWTAVADGDNYSTEDVRASGVFGIPYETRHAQNSRLVLMPVEIDQHEEVPSLFTATLTWTSEPLSQKDEDQKEDNPLDRRPRITVKTGKMRETKHRDFYGKLKVNTAGDLFDPPIESNVSFRVINIRKNVTVFPDWVFDFDDSVNSVPFTIKGRIIDKGCAWIADIELGEEQYDIPNTPYCEAKIEIHIRKRRKPTAAEVAAGTIPPDPWQTEQLNEGINQLVEILPATTPKTYNKVRCTVKSDDTASSADTTSSGPVPLDEDGLQIPTLTPSTIDDDTIFIVFRDQEELDFNQISYLWS